MGGDSVLFARYTGGDSVLVNKKEWGGFCPGGDFVRIPHFIFQNFTNLLDTSFETVHVLCELCVKPDLLLQSSVHYH